MSAKGLGSRGIIGEYYATLEQGVGAAYVDPISNYFASNQEVETYKWLGMAPAMRQWVGGRQARGFRENGVDIRNLTFEATIEVLLDDLRRDKTGQIMVRIRELAQRTNAHWGKLLSDLIVNGASRVCYDGQFFFDTDHSEGDSGAQSNSISLDVVTPASPTAGEMETAILKAVEQILGFIDDVGEPMNEEAARFLVMTPVPLMNAAAAALKNPIIIDGGQSRTNTIVNVGGFQFELAVTPRINALGNKFVVFRTDTETRALIRQEEEGVSLAAIAEGSELEFKENRHEYGVKAIRNVGYGYWQRACLASLT